MLFLTLCLSCKMLESAFQTDWEKNLLNILLTLNPYINLEKNDMILILCPVFLSYDQESGESENSTETPTRVVGQATPNLAFILLATG